MHAWEFVVMHEVRVDHRLEGSQRRKTARSECPATVYDWLCILVQAKRKETCHSAALHHHDLAAVV